MGDQGIFRGTAISALRRVASNIEMNHEIERAEYAAREKIRRRNEQQPER